MGSVGAKNLTAPIVVVSSFEELTAKSKETPNKIVVFNQPWDGDNVSLTFDVVQKGASEAAKVGAIGCLIRSATPFSLGTMHVGVVQYQSGVSRIPVASITVEDAEYLYSLYSVGSVRDTLSILTIPSKQALSLTWMLKQTLTQRQTISLLRLKAPPNRMSL